MKTPDAWEKPWVFDPAYPDWTEAHHIDWQNTKRRERRTEQCVAGCDGIADPDIVVPELVAFVKEYLDRVECNRRHKIPSTVRLSPILEARAVQLRNAWEKGIK